MQIETPEALIAALRASGLFSPEQFEALVRDLTPVPRDFQTLLRQLLAKNRLTTYQLRKVIHGKTPDLLVGPYVILDKLGEGGMGRVYRARHSRVGREVAIKIVRAHLLSNPVIKKRYLREVETASTLHHPNIVGVDDAGEVEGRCYLAMEFVDGLDLARLSRDYQPLGVAEACEYARQAALGLEHAHEAGFVHRDIKPSNVIVAGARHVPQATEPAVVKILDMGLVRTVGFEENGDAGTDLTRAGTVVGTPDYMAPEQAKNSSTVDHRADLYSLGCTLYFLLTGRPPFADGTPIEKLIKHQIEVPTPLQALRPEIPGEVAAVVMQLMAKKPNERFGNAGEVADALAPLSKLRSDAAPASVRVRRRESGAAASSQREAVAVAPVPLPTKLARSAQPGEPTRGSRTADTADDGDTPFSSLADPPSGPLDPETPRARPRPLPKPVALQGTRWILWVALILSLAVTGFAVWMAFHAAK